MTDSNSRVADNLARVRGQIADAAKRSGRTAEDVRLVAVTKYQSVAVIRALLACGCRDLGESRSQELWAKSDSLAGDVCGAEIRWHFVGHLQRNKIRRTLALVTLIHSVDSLRLVQALEEQARIESRTVDCLLEVNISGDAAKHGFSPQNLETVLGELSVFKRVRVVGLMGMAALEGGEVVARRNFAELRTLRDKMRLQCPPNVRLDELSMGMSDDFQIAIEEGATIVRVGSALFEGVEE